MPYLDFIIIYFEYYLSSFIPLRMQSQGIKLDFFILFLKFALIKFHRYIILELDKAKIGKLKTGF